MWTLNITKLGNLALGAALMGGCGGAVAWAINNAPGLFVVDGFVPAAAFGAALAGGLVAPMLGGGGRRGWLLGFVGALLATFVGALLATLFFVGPNLYDALAGPLFVFGGLVHDPFVLLVWTLGMIATHLGLRHFGG